MIERIKKIIKQRREEKRKEKYSTSFANLTPEQITLKTIARARKYRNNEYNHFEDADFQRNLQTQQQTQQDTQNMTTEMQRMSNIENQIHF